MPTSDAGPADAEAPAPANAPPANTANKKRAFELDNESVSLVILRDAETGDVQVDGVATLTLSCTQGAVLDEVALQLRQCQVKRILVNDTPAEFTHSASSNSESQELGKDRDLASLRDDAVTEWKRSEEKGDLVIAIPASARQPPKGASTSQPPGAAADAMEVDQGNTEKTDSTAQDSNAQKVIILDIVIEYSMTDPASNPGLCIVYPPPVAEDEPQDGAITLSRAPSPTAARFIFPCFDRLDVSCTWDIELTVDAGLVAVCSGDLTGSETVMQGTRTIHQYKIEAPTIAKNVFFAVGPWTLTKDPKNPMISYYTTESRVEELLHSTQSVSETLAFFQSYTGQEFPFESMNICFIDDAPVSVAGGAGCALVTSDALHPPRYIEYAVDSRRFLATALAQQIFGSAVIQEFWSDTWVVEGLCAHLVSRYVRKNFGYNEFRYHIVKEMETVRDLEDSLAPVLSLTDNQDDEVGPQREKRDPIHATSPLVRHKSAVVMYLLEQHISEASLQSVYQRILDTAMGGDDEGGMRMGTSTFLKIVNEISGADVTRLANLWIYGVSYPRFKCGFLYSRRRNDVEFVVRQLPVIPGHLYNGPLTVRFREQNGTYDHVIQIQDEVHCYQLTVHGKGTKIVKRKRLNEKGEEVDELAKRTDTPILYIHVDPELELNRVVEFTQPENMWINMLERSGDVAGQQESLAGLKELGSFRALAAFKECLDDGRMFYQIRGAAAIAMAVCARHETEWQGLDFLSQFYKREFYESEYSHPKRNDFTDYGLMRLKEICIFAFAKVHNAKGETIEDVTRIVIDTLKHNDNTANPFDDTGYLAYIIRGLQSLRLNLKSSNAEKLKHQLLRYLQLDKLMPSRNFEVTQAIVLTLGDLHDQLRIEKKFFASYLEEGIDPLVRMAAVCALFRMEMAAGSKTRDAFLLVLEFIEQATKDHDENLQARGISILTRGNMHNPLAIRPVFASPDQLLEREQLTRPLMLSLQARTPENTEVNARVWSILQQLATTQIPLYNLLAIWYHRMWGEGTPDCLKPAGKPAKPIPLPSEPVATERPKHPMAHSQKVSRGRGGVLGTGEIIGDVDDGQTAEPPAKRPRGRPPKAGGTGRPRGRPPANPAAAAAKPGPRATNARGRGRPRRFEDYAGESDSEERIVDDYLGSSDDDESSSHGLTAIAQSAQAAAAAEKARKAAPRLVVKLSATQTAVGPTSDEDINVGGNGSDDDSADNGDDESDDQGSDDDDGSDDNDALSSDDDDSTDDSDSGGVGDGYADDDDDESGSDIKPLTLTLALK